MKNTTPGVSQFSDLGGAASKSQLPTQAVTTDDTQTITGQKTIATTVSQPGLICNHVSMGTVGDYTDDGLAQLILWGAYSDFPASIFVNGDNSFNGKQDPVFGFGNNVGNGGAKRFSGQPSAWVGMEPWVKDDSDASGPFYGITDNHEFNYQTRPLDDTTRGQRWIQLRTRLGVGGATGNNWLDHGQWTLVIAGTYGCWTVTDPSANPLLNITTPGDVQIRRNLNLGETVSGVSGTGNLTMGGTLTIGGNGSVAWDASGVGTVLGYSGATGRTTLSQIGESPSLVARPFNVGTPYSTPAIQATQSDGSTVSCGLGQSGLVVGAGTLKFTGNAALSGFGGFEVANVSGVGAAYAAGSHNFYNASATGGGSIALPGGGSVALDVSGVGTVFNFSGTTGTTTLSQFGESALLVVKPYANGSSYATPGIQATKSDGATMAAALGQSGVQVGAGTLKFTGNAALSGFGGFEIANVAGVGAAYAAGSHNFYAADAATAYMNLDSTGLTVRGTGGSAVLQAGGSGISVGGGAVIKAILPATATLDFGSTASGATTDLTVSVTGAVLGNPVLLPGLPATPADKTFFTAWTSAPDTVTVRFHNYSGGAVDPASGVYNIIVFKI